MQQEVSLQWWETPLSADAYIAYSITQGSWHNDTFVVPIDGMRAPQRWDRWLCLITAPIWVRIFANEGVGWWVESKDLKRPDGPFRGPFYRITGRSHDALHDYLKLTRGMSADALLLEYLISSNENEIHILTREEPTFRMIKQALN